MTQDLESDDQEVKVEKVEEFEPGQVRAHQHRPGRPRARKHCFLNKYISQTVVALVFWQVFRKASHCFISFFLLLNER